MTFSHPLRAALLLSLAALLPDPSVSAQQLAFEQVVAQLKSPDADQRLSAVKLLGESGYPEAAIPVAPLLADKELRVQREAVYAELAFFVPTSRRDGRAAMTAFNANWAAMPIDRVPIEVVTGLLPLLTHPDNGLRMGAAWSVAVLGQVDGIPPDPGHKAVVEALAARMGDADAAMRAAIAKVAGRVYRRCPGGCSVLALERIGDGLVRLLNDSDPAVRSAAMEGLGELRYERAVKALLDILAYQKTGEAAWEALDTLARIGHASCAPAFKAALASKDPNFRQSAVEGLARIGGQEAAAALDAAAVAEREAAVLLAVEFAQQRMGRASHTTRLVEALGSRSSRAQAQDYLVELGPAAAREVASALAAAREDVRVPLLEVLSVTGTAGELAAIDPLQKDPDSRVAGAARRAAARIRSLKR